MFDLSSYSDDNKLKFLLDDKTIILLKEVL